MSIFFKEPEKFVTKKGTYAGMPAMKVFLGPLKAHYPCIAEPNTYKGNCTWNCNVLVDEAGQVEVEDLLLRFAKAHIAEATKRGMNKGDPDDPIKLQWKAKKVKGEGNVEIVNEDGEKILKLESWKWKEGEEPKPALDCFIEEDGLNKRIPNKEAIWYTGSEVYISGFAAVTYDESGENWVVRITPKQVKCTKIVKSDTTGGCDFGDEAPASDFDESPRNAASHSPEEEPNW